MNDSIANASTEVHHDVSISDRLAVLNLSGDDGQTSKSANNSNIINNNNHNHLQQQQQTDHEQEPQRLEDDQHDDDVNLATKDTTCSSSTTGDLNVTTGIEQNTSTTEEKVKFEQTNDSGAHGHKEGDNVVEDTVPSTSVLEPKSAESTIVSQSGEISDNSECSVEEEEEEGTTAADQDCENRDDNLASNELADEEMSLADQDDEDDSVEEEEEFHEVEEDKLRTSQESVGNLSNKNASSSSIDKQNTQLKVESQPEAGASSEAASAEEKVSEQGVVCEIKNNELKQTHDEAASGCVPDKVNNEEAPQPTATTNQTSSSHDESSKKADDGSISATNTSKDPSAKGSDWADIMLSTKLDDGEVKSTEDHNSEGAKICDDDNKGKDPEKKELDLDEDVKNPQYIPKKGVFYEHDDRSHDAADSKKQTSTSVKKDEESTEVKDSDSNKRSNLQEKQNENRRGRKQRTETDRWNHDLFRDEKQKPKSKNELINAYGYDIRQERVPRNQAENRSERTNTSINNSTDNKLQQQQGNQDNPRGRQSRENRSLRQNQATNRSRDRRPRRQNNRNNRNDMTAIPMKRDAPLANRPARQDIKDAVKQDSSEFKNQNLQSNNQQPLLATPPSRRDQTDGFKDKNTRTDSRGRRQDSNDRRPPIDDKLPPLTDVMPPMTTWSNNIEDMVKEKAAVRKDSPSRGQHHHSQGMSNSAKVRSNDYWPQGHSNKGPYHERPNRNTDDTRHQQHPRRYQDRDENHRPTQFMNRNHYSDRSNQHQDWRRTNQYSSHVKPGEFEPIKTQTFENSRLSQSMNKSNFRDAREIINERRMQNQQAPQSKVHMGSNSSDQHQQLQPALQQSQQQPQHQQQSMQQQRQPHQAPQQSHQQSRIVQHSQSMHHSQLMVNPHGQQPSGSQMIRHQPTHLQQQHAPQGMRLPQHQQQQPGLEQAAAQHQQQQSLQLQGTTSQQQQPQQRHQQQHAPQQQQHQQQSPHQGQPQRHGNLVVNSMTDGHSDGMRLNATSTTTSDLINSRPIIKTDAYNGAGVSTHTHQQQATMQQQHSQNHRSLAGNGSMSQQPGPISASSHLVPSHLAATGSQAPYYTPSNNSRDSAAAAAALAPAYHGYMPGGHSVMDTARFMASQQLSDHGYMATPGQTADVAAASVMHQQGLYTDATATGGTVASSAYMAAQAGSTLSPSANIPVTGAGPPLAPMTYLQHSQYAPPPYSNLYSQPQHNQAPPPQSSHAHYPFWPYHL